MGALKQLHIDCNEVDGCRATGYPSCQEEGANGLIPE